MSDLCESHVAYSIEIVFGISRRLGSQVLFPQSPVDRSSIGDDQSTCQFIVIRASSIVQIDTTSLCAFSCSFSSKMQTPVLRAIDIPKQEAESYHILNAPVLIVLAENSNGMFNIWLSCSHRVDKASNHELVYGRMTGFFVGLPLLELHCHWHGNWSGLNHSKHCQDCAIKALLMNVDCVMLPIAFHVQAEIEADTTEIIHLEPLFYQILDLPNGARVSNDEEIIDVQNDSRIDYAVILLIVELEQCSIDT